MKVKITLRLEVSSPEKAQEIADLLRKLTQAGEQDLLRLKEFIDEKPTALSKLFNNLNVLKKFV